MNNWKTKVKSVTWDEVGNVVVKTEITLPQKVITLPEALAIGEFIEQSSENYRMEDQDG